MRREMNIYLIMKILRIGILIFLVVFPAKIMATPSHYLFTALLSEHIFEDRVNYRQLCNDGRFLYYIEQLSETDPEKLVRPEEKLAFWINAYNAYTLKIVCEHYPIKSINNLHFGWVKIGSLLNKTVWDRNFILINNKKMTLNQIEHEILRKKFQDPRIHFAIICASSGCPLLPKFAYTGENVQMKLEEETRKYLNSERGIRIDYVENTLQISKLFDWFAGDFESKSGSAINFIKPYLNDEGMAFLDRKPRISYISYNWALNAKEPIK